MSPMCRKHVWANFCLSYNKEKLLDDNSVLQDYGIRNNSQVQFYTLLTSKKNFAWVPFLQFTYLDVLLKNSRIYCEGLISMDFYSILMISLTMRASRLDVLQFFFLFLTGKFHKHLVDLKHTTSSSTHTCGGGSAVQLVDLKNFMFSFCHTYPSELKIRNLHSSLSHFGK